MSRTIFTTTSARKPKRSTFSLSHELVTATDVGKLTTILAEPTIPGDTIKWSADLYMRFMALQSPAMARIDAYLHFFSVPYRLLYKQFRTFMTGGKDGTTEEVYPRFRVDFSKILGFTSQPGATISNDLMRRVECLQEYFGIGSNLDYLGFPVLDIAGTYLKYHDQPSKLQKEFDKLYIYDLLPILALYRVWCDYYRDENLSDIYNIDGDVVDEFEPIDSGIYDASSYIKLLAINDPVTGEVTKYTVVPNMISEALRMKYRAWEKDYFTSALPWAQRGGDVVIPGTTGTGAMLDLSIEPKVDDDGTTSSVQGVLSGDVYIDTPKFKSANDPNAEFTPGYARDDRGALHMIAQPTGLDTSSSDGLFSTMSGDHIRGDVNISSLDIAEKLQVVQSQVRDLQSAEGTINNLRRANALQKYLEAMARGGSRYIEQIKQIFGVTSSDARLQRSEFLGGGKSPVVISEVLQQSADSISPSGQEQVLGDYAGRAVTGNHTRKIKRFFEEHGILLGILSIKPRSSYASQGMPRKFSKFDRYDYANPYFANLGEQEIKNQELYYLPLKSGADLDPRNQQTFGYAPRYSEYKHVQSYVTGKMRTDLAYWNLARSFKGIPSLNSDFIEVRPEDADRIFTLDNEIFVSDGVDSETGESHKVMTVKNDRLVCQLVFNIKAKRCLPRNSTPRL